MGATKVSEGKMTRTVKFSIIGVLLIVAGLILRGCFKDSKPPVSFTNPLDESTTAQIVVEDRHVAVRTTKTVKAGYVPDDGYVVASIEKTGDVSFDVKNKGFTFRPVIGVLVTDGVRGAAGAQLGYWNRFELHAGLAYPSLIGYGGLAYRLDQFNWTRNTSVLVAYTTDKHIGVGIVVRF